MEIKQNGIICCRLLWRKGREGGSSDASVTNSKTSGFPPLAKVAKYDGPSAVDWNKTRMKIASLENLRGFFWSRVKSTSSIGKVKFPGLLIPGTSFMSLASGENE
ncbi:hypothetical protein CRENBAI_014358 [Crenichthys baileyi]|uniref:Uncharacterized protein n=1 Tax=Crenichthys baileyi TaxID=28760 RepID=A0AAV9RY02_9TELE